MMASAKEYAASRILLIMRTEIRRSADRVSGGVASRYPDSDWSYFFTLGDSRAGRTHAVRVRYR